MSGTILGTEDTVVNAKDKNSYPHQVYILIWGALGFPDGSVGKESACSAGDPDLIPGKICWRRDSLPTPVFLGFSGGSAGKESACSAADLGSIPGLRRSPGKGKGYHSNILTWRIPRTV